VILITKQLYWLVIIRNKWKRFAFIYKIQIYIQQLEKKVSDLKTQREVEQEEMRVKFLRGVSMLNQEAIGMFRTFKSNTNDIKLDSEVNFQPRNTESRRSNTGDEIPKRVVPIQESIQTTNGLVTRHFIRK
jgi:hypothetical protein